MTVIFLAIIAILSIILCAVVYAFVRYRRIPRRFWLVGQYRRGAPPNIAWDFQGIFSSREAALDACIERTYFLAPVDLDKVLPKDPVEMPQVVYPLIKER